VKRRLVIAVAVGILATAAAGVALLPRRAPPTSARETGDRSGSGRLTAEADRMPGSSTSTDAGRPGDWFEDVTARSGISHTFSSGAERGHLSILESLGGGVAVFDADGAGGGRFAGDDAMTIEGRPSSLWRNDGRMRFTDITVPAGIDTGRLYTHGAAVADYDRDGREDLLVTGYGGLMLFHNDGGRFTDVTAAAGLGATTVAGGGPAWNTSAAWADFDGDGDTDLFVCRYVNWSFATHRRCWYHDESVADVCPPRAFEPLPAALYRNDGDGTFTDVAAAVGLLEPTSLAAMKGLGVVAADLDDDRRPDLYMANDTTPNLLFLNRGGSFTETAASAGMAGDDRGVSNGSMGIAVGDPFGSGRPAVFVTNYQHELPALYRNDGGGFFTFASRSSGVAAVGLSHVGFGTALADFDRDGWEDLVIANGHVIRHPQGTTIAQQPSLLVNTGRGRFAVATDAGGAYFRSRHHGRGLAVGDLDDDGGLDLIVSHLDEPVAVLRNQAGSGNAWIGLELADAGRRDPAGGRVELRYAGTTQHRFLVGGGTYLSHGDRRLVFGLGPRVSAETASLRVAWPDGTIDRRDGLEPGRYHRLARSGITAEATADDRGRP
jgi:hypothetical protein